MKLRIENFAKIKEAKIQLDGITVIAGLNDTGKSTVGKVLYSIFNSLNTIDISVANKRNSDIENILREVVEGVLKQVEYFTIDDDGNVVSMAESLTKKIVEYDGELSKQVYKELLQNKILEGDEDADEEAEKEALEEYVESTYNRVYAIKNTPDIDLYKEVLERYFSRVFGEQMNNCDSQESIANVTLTLKSKEIKASFQKNQCVKIEMPMRILHEAFFIDDPFVLDSISPRSRYSMGGFGIRDNLIRRIMFSGKSIMDGIFDAVTSKESLKEINDVFDKVVDGKIVNTREGMKYSSQGHKEPIAVVNLSAGLKGFILIRTLLEKGILKEKDVLILDEPEVHMHTQWQLFYAQIIVLLQKYFDLTILVTTHSSHFLQAIEYYSKYYRLDEKCNYYLAQKGEDGVTFEDVTEDTSKIYSEMVEPSILLDKLEEELEYKDEE